MFQVNVTAVFQLVQDMTCMVKVKHVTTTEKHRVQQQPVLVEQRQTTFTNCKKKTRTTPTPCKGKFYLTGNTFVFFDKKHMAVVKTCFSEHLYPL